MNSRRPSSFVIGRYSGIAYAFSHATPGLELHSSVQCRDSFIRLASASIAPSSTFDSESTSPVRQISLSAKTCFGLTCSVYEANGSSCFRGLAMAEVMHVSVFNVQQYCIWTQKLINEPT